MHQGQTLITIIRLGEDSFVKDGKEIEDITWPHGDMIFIFE